MNFQKIYSQLNKQQRKAVDLIDGPVMVIAGPGTGKTQVLAARIANILAKTDSDPQSILALTFTDAAATTMRERLFKMIGSTAYRVRIQTFHSFCDEVIRSHPEYFELGLEAEPLSQLELTEF
ncbi:MAG: UvrD-helicase domain-containing protein, partial [Patescibacteria group bacterium]